MFVSGADFRAPSEKQLLGLASGLLRAGHAVAISIAGDPATLTDEQGPDLAGLSVWSHGMRRLSPDPAALREAREFEPALVHAYNCRLPVVTAAASYCDTLDVPAYVHFEDDEWSLARRGGPPPVRALRQSLARAHAAVWPFADLRTFEWAVRARGVDAVTPMLAKRVSERLDRDCAAVLPAMRAFAGPDCEPPLPPDLDGRPLVAFTGSVFGVHHRDLVHGLRAVGRVRERRRDVAFVHTGRTARRLPLSRLAREAGLERGAARTLGYLSRSQLQGLLRRASVLVQPGLPTDFNRYRLPAKLHSYLASGTPTVTYAAGPGELVEDRVEVLKTFGEDPDELASRISEALDDDALRRALSAGGPRAAARLFDADRNAARLVEHYRRGL